MQTFLKPLSSLSGKTACCTILIGAIIALVISGFMYGISVDVLKKRELQTLASSVEASVDRFSSHLQFPLRDVTFLAEVPEIPQLMQAAGNRSGGVISAQEQIWRDRLAEVFRALINVRPEYYQVRLIGVADGGRELVRVERSLTGEILRTPEDRLQPKGDRPYFMAASRLQPGELYVSKFELNQEFGQIEVPHRPVFRVATPIYDGSGELFGIVILNVEASHFFTLVTGLHSMDRAHFVTNGDGDYLYAPDIAKTFGFDLGTPYRIQDDYPELTPLFEGDMDQLTAWEGEGEQMHVVAAQAVSVDPLQPERHLYLISTLSGAALLHSIHEQGLNLALIAAAVIGASVVFAIVMAKAVTHPLIRLTAMARSIASGDREVDIDALTHRRDETGELARATQQMMGEIKRREAELVSQIKEVERSNAEISQFAYIASHDLQEPLRMVGSYLGLLERRYADKLDDEAREFIAFAVDGAERMKRLINDLLSYSRVSNRELKQELFDTNEVVGNIAKSYEARVAEYGGQITVDDLPKLKGDVSQFERLMTNFIDNALKYRSDKPPHIHVSAKRNGQSHEFIIADNGIGIDPKHKDKIFEIFTRLHSRETHPGNGIGLASCKRIIERHGGTIWVTSASGGGSVFHFTCPIE